MQEAEEACESWIVEDGGEKTDRGRERVRREVVVGYLLGCMGLGVKKAVSGDELPEEADGEEEGAMRRETVEQVAKEVEAIKLDK